MAAQARGIMWSCYDKKSATELPLWQYLIMPSHPSTCIAYEGEDVVVACSHQEKDALVDCLFWQSLMTSKQLDILTISYLPCAIFTILPPLLPSKRFVAAMHNSWLCLKAAILFVESQLCLLAISVNRLGIFLIMPVSYHVICIILIRHNTWCMDYATWFSELTTIMHIQ